MHKLYDKKMMSSGECADYARRKWLNLRDCESVYAMFLTKDYQLDLFRQVNTGCYRGTNFNLREIVKTALNLNIDHIIIFHNHTSGNSNPSEMDKELTAGLIDVYQTLGINFDDHIILTANDHYSFSDHHLLQTG